MTKHQWIKSIFSSHIDPETDQELKGTMIDTEDKIQKILKLIKDGNENENSNKEPLVELIEDGNLLSSKIVVLSEEIKQAHKKFQDLVTESSQLREKLDGRETELLTYKEMHEAHLSETDTRTRDLQLNLETLQSHKTEIEKQKDDEVSVLVMKLEDKDRDFLSQIQHLITEKSMLSEEIKQLLDKIQEMVTESSQMRDKLKGKETNLLIHKLIHEAYVCDTDARTRDLENKLEELHLHKTEMEKEKNDQISSLFMKLSDKEREFLSQIQHLTAEKFTLLEEIKQLQDKISSDSWVLGITDGSVAKAWPCGFCSSPRMSDGPSKELKGEQSVDGSDEEIDVPPDEDFSDDNFKEVEEEGESFYNLNIPTDSINLILLRLPVKPLLRCKAVSKEWYSMISSDGFKNSHLKRSIEGKKVVIIHDYDENFVDSKSIAVLNTSSPRDFSRLEFPYEATNSLFIPSAEVIGSSRGILCVSVVNKANPSFLREPYMYLWNPATKQSKPIPLPPIVPVHALHTLDFNNAFAFDYIDKDFKVVRLGDNTVEVYSANSNTWHLVESPGSIPFQLQDYRFCVDGILCFANSHSHCITAFDLNREVYNGRIKCPSLGFGECKIVTCLDNPPVTFLYCEEFSYLSTVHLWTLENIEYLSGGVEPSWVPMHRIDISRVSDIHGYFVSADHGRNLLLVNDVRAGWCLLDDPRVAGNYPLPLSRCLGKVFKYTESLVSIPGFEQVTWNARDLVDEDGDGVGSAFFPIVANFNFVLFLLVVCFMCVIT